MGWLLDFDEGVFEAGSASDFGDVFPGDLASLLDHEPIGAALGFGVDVPEDGAAFDVGWLGGPNELRRWASPNALERLADQPFGVLNRLLRLPDDGSMGISDLDVFFRGDVGWWFGFHGVFTWSVWRRDLAGVWLGARGYRRG